MLIADAIKNDLVLTSENWKSIHSIMMVNNISLKTLEAIMMIYEGSDCFESNGIIQLHQVLGLIL